MSDFEISKGKAPADAKELGAPKIRYPWPQMEVEDCFEKLLKDAGERQSILSSLKYFQLKNPSHKFAYKIEREGEGSKAKVLKIWRTA